MVVYSGYIVVDIKSRSSIIVLFIHFRVENRLRKEAADRGITPERLIFASKLSKAEHLKRHQQCDLFLDTLYYCAQTTAADALWAGIPLLTLPGQTYTSRVAGGLL